MENKEFFYRRLHSLLGVVPIGIFLLQHLTVNHFAAYSPESFNKAAHFMESLPFRYALEIFVIFLPILFHAVLGVYIVLTAKNNVRRHGFFRNWMFLLQRISGIITLVFIAWHVWETRIQIGLGTKELGFNMMEDILSNPFMFAFYLLGVVSTTFHFANGLWSFLVTWGITVTPRSQRIATYATLIVFLAVTYIGVRALFAFV
ncbi:MULTISPECIES: succinate dehydrogenase cytochrome b558 subunit [Gracilibacillus]|uniref:succinate dehydrogenase cytochrome b558 subunit n=1 Tax=Gracilibacillus TaxID=74385 RepID=UPI000825035D|nr:MULTISPECIES: succinate dehydrogenase cytochrome b558 subunit [Gracilibacillus]